MPEMNGLELTDAVRRSTATPIIVLSVRDTGSDEDTGTRRGCGRLSHQAFQHAGAARPGAQPSFAQRSRNLRLAETHIEVGDFIIDLDAHTVAVTWNAAVHLTPKEFDLLLFARNPGRVLTHKVLLRAVWGTAGEDQPEYLRVLVAAAQKDRTSNPRSICTASLGSAIALTRVAATLNLRTFSNLFTDFVRAPDAY